MEREKTKKTKPEKKDDNLSKFASLASGNATLMRVCSIAKRPDDSAFSSKALKTLYEGLASLNRNILDANPKITLLFKAAEKVGAAEEKKQAAAVALAKSLPAPFDDLLGPPQRHSHWDSYRQWGREIQGDRLGAFIRSTVADERARKIQGDDFYGRGTNLGKSLGLAVMLADARDGNGVFSAEWNAQACESMEEFLAAIEKKSTPETMEACSFELSKAVCCAFFVGSDTRVFFPVHGLGLKTTKLRSEAGAYVTAYAYAPVSSAIEDDPHKELRKDAERANPELRFGERLDSKTRTIPGDRNILPSCSGMSVSLAPKAFSPETFKGSVLSFSEGEHLRMGDPDSVDAMRRLRDLSLLCAGAVVGVDASPFSKGDPFVIDIKDPLAGTLADGFKPAAAFKGDGASAAIAIAGIVKAADIALRSAASSFVSSPPADANDNDNWIDPESEHPFSRAGVLEGGHISEERIPAILAASKAACDVLTSKAAALSRSAALSNRIGEAMGALVERLEERALVIAKAREEAWFETNGLLDAFKAASIGNKNGIGAKHLAFYAQNPQTAKAAITAHNDPDGRLAMALSRCAGLSRADDTGSLKEAIISSCEPQGLSRAGFFAATANPDVSLALQNAAAAVFEDDPRVANERRLLTLRTAFRAVSEWAKDEAPNPGAFGEALNAFVLSKDDMDAINELAGEDISTLFVKTAKSSAAVMTRTKAKRDLSNRLSLLCVLAFSKDADDDAREFLSMAGSGGIEKRRWEDFGLDASHADIMLGIPKGLAPMAAAMAMAGPLERCASHAAVLSGAEQALSTNETASIGREFLKSSLGFSNAAWKALSEPHAAESLVASLRAELVSEERFNLQYATHASFSGGESDSAARKNHMETQARWLGWASSMGFPSEASKTLLLLACSESDSSVLGRQAVGIVWGLLGPFHPSAANPQNTAQAEQAFAEITAREARAPHLAKAVCERLAFHMAKEPPTTSVFFAELELVCDWIIRSEAGFWQALPEKPTWGQMMRLQADWHEAVVAGAVKQSSSRSPQWAVILGEHSDGGVWSAREMANGNDLVDEGRAMHHCVSSYSGNCKRGECRIFSITRGGERVCTLELEHSTGKGDNGLFSAANPDPALQWKITQNKGNCNASVSDPATLAFCKEVERAFNLSYKTLCEERARAREEAAAKGSATRRAKAKDRTFAIIEDLETVGSAAVPKASKSMEMLAKRAAAPKA